MTTLGPDSEPPQSTTVATEQLLDFYNSLCQGVLAQREQLAAFGRQPDVTMQTPVTIEGLAGPVPYAEALAFVAGRSSAVNAMAGWVLLITGLNRLPDAPEPEA